MLGKELSDSMKDSLEWAPLLFAIGNLLFNVEAFYSLDNQSSWISSLDIMGVIIAAIQVVLPMEDLLKSVCSFCCNTESDLHGSYDGYNTHINQFNFQDYEFFNPVTKLKAVRELFEREPELFKSYEVKKEWSCTSSLMDNLKNYAKNKPSLAQLGGARSMNKLSVLSKNHGANAIVLARKDLELPKLRRPPSMPRRKLDSNIIRSPQANTQLSAKSEFKYQVTATPDLNHQHSSSSRLLLNFDSPQNSSIYARSPDRKNFKQSMDAYIQPQNAAFSPHGQHSDAYTKQYAEHIIRKHEQIFEEQVQEQNNGSSDAFQLDPLSSNTDWIQNMKNSIKREETIIQQE